MALLLVPCFTLSTRADEIWTVVSKESHWAPGWNRLVIQRQRKASATQISKAISDNNGRFLFISGGSIYLGDQNAGSLSEPADTTEFARRRYMNLVKIGESAFRVYCYRCFLDGEGSIDDNRITFDFVSTIGDPQIAMAEMVILKTP